MDRHASPPDKGISRAPVVVLIVGGALALGLVLLGAEIAATPAPSPGPAATPGSAFAPRQISVIMRDYRFDPTPLFLFGGETVELHVFNAGLVDHELVLGDERVQQAWARADAAATPGAPFASAPPASVPPGTGGLRVLLPSGASTVVRYAVPAGTPVAMICHLPGHAERGMVGRIDLAEASGDSR